MDLTVRSAEPERMDDGAVGVREMRGALADLDRLASFLGGWSASLGPLRARLAGRKRVRILDVGAGSGAMALALVRDARRRGVDARVVAVELHPAACRVAGETAQREAALRVVRADAQRLPFADGAFDFSFGSLFLHHFAGPELRAILGEMRRVASDGVVVADLERSRPAYWGVWLASRLLTRSPVTRHDGPLSVRRAFRREDLEEWTRVKGMGGLRWRRAVPFRWVAWTFEPAAPAAAETV
jgi:SAM-dependent methyltransferase